MDSCVFLWELLFFARILVLKWENRNIQKVMRINKSWPVFRCFSIRCFSLFPCMFLHSFSTVFMQFWSLFSLNPSLPSHRSRRASMCLGGRQEAKSISREVYNPSRRRLISISEINPESKQKPCKSMPNPWKTFSLFFNSFFMISLVLQWSFADLAFSVKATRFILNYTSTPLFRTRRGGTDRCASESAIDTVAARLGHLQKSVFLDSCVFPPD